MSSEIKSDKVLEGAKQFWEIIRYINILYHFPALAGMAEIAENLS